MDRVDAPEQLVGTTSEPAKRLPATESLNFLTTSVTVISGKIKERDFHLHDVATCSKKSSFFNPTCHAACSGPAVDNFFERTYASVATRTDLQQEHCLPSPSSTKRTRQCPSILNTVSPSFQLRVPVHSNPCENSAPQNGCAVFESSFPQLPNCDCRSSYAYRGIDMKNMVWLIADVTNFLVSRNINATSCSSTKACHNIYLQTRTSASSSLPSWLSWLRAPC